MRGGNPAASHCASKISCRTPWIDTRPNVSVTVVNAPTTSNSRARLTSWSANALSLPLDHEISAFGRDRVVNGSALPEACAGASVPAPAQSRVRYP